MKFLNEGNPPLASLAHYGVKGMKWGQRKADPTTSEIKDARRKSSAQYESVLDAAGRLNAASGKAKDRAARDYANKVKAYEQDEARVTAEHMTNGEKVAAALMAGPIGLVVIARNKTHVKRTAEDVDDARRHYSKQK